MILDSGSLLASIPENPDIYIVPSTVQESSSPRHGWGSACARYDARSMTTPAASTVAVLWTVSSSAEANLTSPVARGHYYYQPGVQGASIEPSVSSIVQATGH